MVGSTSAWSVRALRAQSPGISGWFSHVRLWFKPGREKTVRGRKIPIGYTEISRVSLEFSATQSCREGCALRNELTLLYKPSSAFMVWISPWKKECRIKSGIKSVWGRSVQPQPKTYPGQLCINTSRIEIQSFSCSVLDTGLDSEIAHPRQEQTQVVLAVPCPPKCLLYWHRNNHSLFDYYKQGLFAALVAMPSFHRALFHLWKKIGLIWVYDFFFLWVIYLQHEEQQSFLKAGRGADLKCEAVE